MIAPKTVASHSASVDIQLFVDGQRLSVGKMGPDRIMLTSALNLPACEGELALSVDGNERRWPVRLPEGASESSPFVRVEQLARSNEK